MLLIIDNGSEKIKRFMETLRSWEIKFTENLEYLPQVKGVILSGGLGHPAERTDLQNNYLVLNEASVPIIGICLGHEIMAQHYGAKVVALPKEQTGLQEITVSVKDALLSDIERLLLEKKHFYHVPVAPRQFAVLGYSQTCPIEIMKHRHKPIYGFQGHPEVSADGLIIMKNFLKLCGL